MVVHDVSSLLVGYANILAILMTYSESMTTKHLIHQFKLAINEALSSKAETRALMRARSGKQRFPVAQWVEDLERLQSTAIRKHDKHYKHSRQTDSLQFWRYSTSTLAPSPDSLSTYPRSSDEQTPPNSTSPVIQRFGSRRGPGHIMKRWNKRTSSQVHSAVEEESIDDDSSTAYYSDQEIGALRQARIHQTKIAFTLGGDSSDDPAHTTGDSVVYSRPDSPVPFSGTNTPPGFLTPTGLLTPPGFLTPTGTSTPTGLGEECLLNPPLAARHRQSSTHSLVSVDGIVKEKHDYNLQKVSPFFTDVTNEYARIFQRKLDRLTGKTSEDQLCIEEFLSKSEKDWFNRYRDVKLGKSPLSTPTSSVFRFKINGNSPSQTPTRDSFHEEQMIDQFLLPKDYVPPSGLKRFLLRRIGDWPYYSILLAFGQIIAANSYQVTLLNGELGQTAEKLYVVATIYLVSSIVWWTLFRLVQSVYVLSAAFLVCHSNNDKDTDLTLLSCMA
jgi:alpha-1,3-glucan synthase